LLRLREQQASAKQPFFRVFEGVDAYRLGGDRVRLTEGEELLKLVEPPLGEFGRSGGIQDLELFVPGEATLDPAVAGSG
jgi:hypothetical protein